MEKWVRIHQNGIMVVPEPPEDGKNTRRRCCELHWRLMVLEGEYVVYPISGKCDLEWWGAHTAWFSKPIQSPYIYPVPGIDDTSSWVSFNKRFPETSGMVLVYDAKKGNLFFMNPQCKPEHASSENTGHGDLYWYDDPDVVPLPKEESSNDSV